MIIARHPCRVNITIRIITKAPLWVPLLLSKVGNMYDFPFKVGIKCRLIIDKQEFAGLLQSFNTATISSPSISPVSSKPREAYNFLAISFSGS